MGCPSSSARLVRVLLSRAKVDPNYSQQVLNHSQWNNASAQTAWINNYRRNEFRIFKYLERELEKKQKGRGVLYSCLFHLAFIGGAARVVKGYPILRTDPQKTDSGTYFRFRFINGFESEI